MNRPSLSLLCLFLSAAASAAPPAEPADLATVAESSGFRATSTHAEVMALLERIDAASEVTHLTEMGRTFEDRSIPLLIIADPPVTTPAEAKASGKAIVFAFGNIHAGEVCGKEALLMLARELATGPSHPLLHDVIVLFAPIYNGDGNDRMDTGNRPGQVGPVEGMGQRPNAQGFDLNRDWIKLESPEARANVKLMTEWDPHVTIDTHTTNGSHHRYVLTYSAPLNPSGFMPSIEFVRDELLPAVSARMLEGSGYHTFFYGNFNREHTAFATYSADPRYGGPYRGLRGQMAILSEAYAYASYEDRVLATREFVREILTFVAGHRDRVLELHRRAREETTRAGLAPQPDDVVGLRHRIAAFPEPVVMLGWEMEPVEGGRPRPTDVPAEHRVIHLGRFEATVSVRRPYAYLIPPGHDAVIEKLRQHGIDTSWFTGAADVEAYEMTTVNRARREFQGHRQVRLDVTSRPTRVTMREGSTMIRTAQPLGNLVVYLLEPQSSDGLAAWNFFDEGLEVGAEFPVYRVPAPM